MTADPTIQARVERLKSLAVDHGDHPRFIEAATLAQSILHDTVGDGHPLMQTLKHSVEKYEWYKILGACHTLITLYEGGSLVDPRLRIAREIEGDILDIAEVQLKAADASPDQIQKQIRLAIFAFLAGAGLEDAMRRLCDKHGLQYDAQRTSISKLQSVLYSPTSEIQAIDLSNNKQITSWGDTRNKADHGRFSEITPTEVLSMIFGVRAFIARRLA